MSPSWFEVKSGWLTDQGRRLEASAYGEGGLTARDHIKAGPWPWCRLEDLARIFSESRFARVYISDPRRGVPYLTGSDMLLSDLSGLLLLSTRRTPQLARLVVERDWILMSCSGTVGRTVFIREDMARIALSHDVIRIVSNLSRVLPGYLFAFLTSAPAQAMIRQHTYGSVVQHIEPHHLADLPVPLPVAPEQRRIHELVEGAARARTEARRLLDEVILHFDEAAGTFRHRHEHARAVGVVSRSKLRQTRLDAFTHIGWSSETPVRNGDRLGTLAEVSRPGLIKRLFVERGTPFVSGVDVFQLRPGARSRLRRDEAIRSGALIKAGQILVQRSGQRYGLLGRPAYVDHRLEGWASSEDLIRVTPRNSASAGRIFAFLCSEAGRRHLVGRSYGTSIPHINPENVSGLIVPSLPRDLESQANRALQLREQADADEELAIREVEAWLG